MTILNSQPSLVLPSAEFSLMVSRLEQLCEVSNESIMNLRDLALIVCEVVRRHTVCVESYVKEPWFSGKLDKSHEWQIERVAQVLRHFAWFDERIDTGAEYAVFDSGKLLQEIDWSWQDLSETHRDGFEGDLDFSMVPTVKTDRLVTSLVYAYEPPREALRNVKGAEKWQYIDSFMKLYDYTIHNSTNFSW